MYKTIGIVGGHGYNATIHFQKVLSDKFNEKYISRKYLKTYLINNSILYSDIEDFNNIYNNNKKDNLLFENDIINSYEILKNINVDLIVLPCNTYSYYLSQLNINSDKILCLNIVEETCKYINKNIINENIKLGIISTKQTVENKLYHKNLNCDLYHYIEVFDDISKIIFCSQYGYYDKPINKDFLTKYNLKDNLNLIDLFNNIVKIYLENNITHLILGCTELPLFYEYNKEKLNNNIIYISSTELLAKSCINYLV